MLIGGAGEGMGTVEASRKISTRRLSTFANDKNFYFIDAAHRGVILGKVKIISIATCALATLASTTDDQTLDLPRDALKRAKCRQITRNTLAARRPFGLSADPGA